MLPSIALILLSGLIFGFLCKTLRLPSLFGMIIAGILLGPHVLNFLSPKVLDISTELRKIALIIILLRAGLKLKMNDLKQVGRPAMLMCFLPASFEIMGMILLAPRFLGVSILDAAILGAVVGAVSPAVIVPKMIQLINDKYGTEKSIPQMILAGASVDDVFVIVMFTTFTGLAKGDGISVMQFVGIPISVLTGIGIGMGTGFVLTAFFRRRHIRDTVKLIILFSAAFILTALEDRFSQIFPFASLIAVMCVGIALNQKTPAQAAHLSARFDKLWIPAEIFLFVLVGATVSIDHALKAGGSVITLILCVLVFRMAGVYVCLLGTTLNRREKAFIMLAYIPKATVQAAIGGLPLAMGLSCGDIVLTVSVIAILLTAPLGALAIDLTYMKLLTKQIMGGAEHD